MPQSNPKKPPGPVARFHKHAENDGAEQRSNEKTKQRLYIIHDAGELHHQIRGADANQHADHGRPPAHVHVVVVRALAIDQRPVDVIRPDGRERAHIPRHAGHEARDQRGNSEAKQTRPAVAREHQWKHVVVTVHSSGGGHRFGHKLHRKHGQAQQSRQNHDQRNKHLESRSDDGGHFRTANILSGENALHDKKIRRPVAHGDNRSQPEHNADPVDSHRVVCEGTQAGPHVNVLIRRPLSNL